MLSAYYFRPKLILSSIGGVLALGGAAWGQETEPEANGEQAAEVAEEVSEYPREVEEGAVLHRFPQEVDGDAHYWGVSGAGVIGWSSGALKSAMAMKVRGQAFVPEKAEEIGRGHYQISGRAGDVVVVRDVRLDFERGVVRYWDQFSPTPGGVDVAVVEYLTEPLGKPVEVLSNSGVALGKGLRSDDFGVVLRNNPGESRRTSAVFVLGATGDVLRPTVVWADDPLLRVVYKVKLDAAQSQGVVVMVGQREVAASNEVKGVFRDLFWRQSLFGAAIPEPETAGVVNFLPASLSGEGVLAPHADELIGVLDIEERLGVERSIRDVLWVSADSQLTGNASGGDVSLSGTLGELRVGFEDVAAMQGGAGLGRQHRLYLRDGTVLGGTVSVDGLKVSGTQGWRIEADLEQLDHLLLRLAEEDGVAPEGTGFFVKLHSGDVLPLALDGAPVLPFVTPWGAVDVPVDEIEVLVYVKVPTPRYRLVLKDGSRLTGFVGGAALGGIAGVVGEVNFGLSAVEAMWPAGEQPELGGGEFAEAESFEEVEPPIDEAGDYCLLRGGNLLAGRLGGGEIHLLTGTTVTAVAAAEITELSREGDDTGELMPEFRVELAGGHVLRGRLREEFLEVETAVQRWSVPVQHFVGARRGTANAEGESL